MSDGTLVLRDPIETRTVLPSETPEAEVQE